MGRDDLHRVFDDVSEDREVEQLHGALGERLFGEGPRAVTIGRYTLGPRVGKGGMGVVHKARDPELDRNVAIKFLAPASGDDGRRQERLLREAEALAAVTHPNVVSVFDVGETDVGHVGGVYVVMEYVEGETLARWFRGARSLDDTLRVLLDAGEGLAAAHDAGLVHRDFKPSNVMVESSGRVCVLDFGLAHAIVTPSSDQRSATRLDRQVTATGERLGTPAYMAPEQWAAKPLGPAADQYAYCVALGEALFGERRALDGTRTMTTDGVRIGAATARRLRAVLERGLSSDPKARFASMRALMSALRAAARPARWPARALGLFVALGSLVGLASTVLQPQNVSRLGPLPLGARLAALGPLSTVRHAPVWIEMRRFEHAIAELESAYMSAVELGDAAIAFETALLLAETHRQAGASVEAYAGWLRNADSHRERPARPEMEALRLSVRAEVALERGDAESARADSEEALALVVNNLGESNPVTLAQRSKLLHLLIQLGDTPGVLREAARLEAHLPQRPGTRAELKALLDTGYARIAVDDQERGREIGERVAASIRDGTVDADLHLRAQMHLLLGSANTNLGRHDEALAELDALRALDPSDFVLMQVEAATGVVLCRRGEAPRGVEHLVSALDEFVGRRGPSYAGLTDLHTALAECYAHLGDERASARHEAEATNLLELASATVSRPPVFDPPNGEAPEPTRRDRRR